MTIPIEISGTMPGNGSSKVEVYNPHTDGQRGGPGLLVYSKDRQIFDPVLRPMFNDDFGISMNQNVSFGGTADLITNGGDTTEWAFSNITGTKASEKDDERAHGAIVTIVDYTALSGDTVTVGVDGSDTIKTEGVDWNAVTSNSVSATALAVELSTITGVSAVAVAAVVTITADSGVNISKLNTSDGTNLPGTGQGIKIDNMGVGNIFEFDKGSNVTVANFVAISGYINVDKDWKNNDSIEMFLYDTGSATEVSARIKVEDFINFGDFDVWQSFVVPFSVMSITSATFDAVRFEQISKDGAKAPKWFLDDFQIEQTGESLLYQASLAPSEVLHVTSLKFSIADTLSLTVADGTAPGLNYKQILGLTRLTNGIVLQRIQAGVIQFAATLRQLSDFMAAGAHIEDVVSDGTNTFITILVEFPAPIVLVGAGGDTLQVIINDNLDGLDLLTCSVIGKVEL